MARQELRTFNDIVSQIMSLIKLQSSDTISKNRIKGDVVRAYLDEVIPYHQWPWLRNKVNVQAQEYFGTGTAAVTLNSVTVTLSETLLVSKQGHYFSVNGSNEIYKIKSHSAGSTTLTLDMPYTSATNATAAFKIWTDSIPLPTDLDQIIEVTHPFLVEPMQGVGLQELRRYTSVSPKSEGRPVYYTLGDWVDPSPYASISGLPATATRASNGVVKTIKFAATLGASASTALLRVGDRIQIGSAGNYTYNIEAIVSSISTTTNTNDTITYTALTRLDEASTADTGISVKKLSTESYERQKELTVYPAVFNSKTNITIDYTKEIAPLENDDDEPELPLSDRIVLFWLGLSYAYSRERNPEEALMYRQMAEQRLARMAGRISESIDKPMLLPSRNYLNSKRQSVRTRSFGDKALGFSGGGTSTNPTGTANQVAVFGADGTLQSSSTISTTELEALNNIVGNIEDRLNALGLPSGSAGNRVLISDSTPAIAESDITSTELTYLDNVDVLTSVTLMDNTAVADVAASWAVASFTTLHIDYSIKRGSAVEAGVIKLVSDGTNAGIAQGAAASLGSNGVVFSADISAGNLRLLYTTTSTGANATLKYKAHKWLA